MKTHILKTVQQIINTISVVVLILSVVILVLPNHYFSLLAQSNAPQICALSLIVFVVNLFKNKTFLGICSFISFIILVSVFKPQLFPKKMDSNKINTNEISFEQNKRKIDYNKYIQ